MSTDKDVELRRSTIGNKLTTPVTQEALDRLWEEYTTNWARSDDGYDDERLDAAFVQDVNELQGDCLAVCKREPELMIEALVGLLRDHDCKVLEDPRFKEGDFMGCAIFWPDAHAGSAHQETVPVLTQ
jgi:hypothetical protein